MIILINGVFFQEREYLSIGRRPGIGEAVFINAGLFMHSYFGVVMHQPGNVMKDGHMSDHYGYSDISEVTFGSSYLEPTIFSFKKKYAKRDDIISYTFTKRAGKVWIGEFEGPAVGKGVSKCVITEVPDDNFFELELDIAKK